MYLRPDRIASTVLILLLATPLPALGQLGDAPATPVPAPVTEGPAVDPRIGALTDSIGKLLKAREEMAKELVAKLPNPTAINSVTLARRSDRALVGVQLDKPGRVEISIRNTDGSVIAQHRTTDIREKHPAVWLRSLAASTPYVISVQVLANDSPGTRLPIVRHGHPGRAGYDSNLSFTTPAAEIPPRVDVSPTPLITHNSITITVQVDNPSLLRASLYEEGPDGQAAAEPVSTLGDKFTTDDLGVPDAPASAYKATRTFTLVGLKPNTEYYYAVEAMSNQGVEGRPASRYKKFKTLAMPEAFGFNGPLDLAIDASRGLVVSWSAKGTAITGSIGLIPPGGNLMLVQPATITNGGKTLTASIASLSLLNTALAVNGPAPVIVAQMRDASGEERTIEVRFQLQAPSKASVAAIPGLTKEQRKRIERLAAAAQNEAKKINWADVATAGLKLVTLMPL